MMGLKNPQAGHMALLALALTVLPCLVAQTNAQIYTMTDANSSATVNVGSQAGMDNWTVDGQNELAQQWFWLTLGNGAPTAINNINAASVVQPSSRLLETTYASSGYSVEVDYLLKGGQTGSGQSDIGESISLNNTSASPLTFHFYQYSDFNLYGAGTQDTGQLGRNLSGKYNLADVENTVGNLTTVISETVATPGANHGEVELPGVTLGKLTGSGPVTLADNSSAGPGEVTWAFEWDVTIQPGGSFLISKDKSIDRLFIPEPSSLALLSLGMALCVLRKRR